MAHVRLTTAALLAASALLLIGCGEEASLPVEAGTGPDPQLPPPNPSFLLPTIEIAPATSWPDGGQPEPAAGLAVTAFARDLDHPRQVYVLPNGDVLVAESDAPPKDYPGLGIKEAVMGYLMRQAGSSTGSANRISLLRDTDGDGEADFRSVFLDGLYSPYGMVLVGNELFVANADALVRFAYEEGQTRIDVPGETVVELPSELNHHWTKNLVASADGSRLYVAVGSNSNVAEYGMEMEEGRAAIWEIDRATGEHRIFASGLRNPVGMAWEPATGALWTAVNERDALGSDLVPDYMTAVQDGGFYGWPWSYFGQHVDERVEPKRPDMVEKAIKPDYALGPHTASLGLSFAEGSSLPEPFTEGAFVGQHGSWNRNPPSGYKVIFVPFSEGRPSGAPQDVLTGFLDEEGNALGRPVGVTIDAQGGLLVADDVGNAVWRVAPAAGPQAATQ